MALHPPAYAAAAAPTLQPFSSSTITTSYHCCSKGSSPAAAAAPRSLIESGRRFPFSPSVPNHYNVRSTPRIVGSQVVPTLSSVRCQAANMEANTAHWSDRGLEHSESRQNSNILGLQKGNLKAVLFDVDGTLCDSDPLHHIAFSESLQEVGFQGGEPISEEFFIEHMTGKDALDVVGSLFPEWDEERRNKFVEDKEARFQRLARERLKPMQGLASVCEWIKERNLYRAAVTNAPRKNAELMISIVGLSGFFQTLVVGEECERGKPFPDPYLKALHHFEIAPNQVFVFEDSSTGLQAAVSAGMPAIAVGTRNPEAALLRAGACLTIPDYCDPKLWDALRAL